MARTRRLEAKRTPYEEFVTHGPRLTPPGVLLVSPGLLRFVSPSRASYGLRVAFILACVFAYLGALDVSIPQRSLLPAAVDFALFLGFFPFLILITYLSQRMALWHPSAVHDVQALEMMPNGPHLAVLMEGQRYVLTFDVPRAMVVKALRTAGQPIRGVEG